ncbi:hypothetical protein CJ179_47055 [Rhodococcus sp. ACS1]|nr:hypothetical protein CJ179_47055 [Rhodococcus sp. ACS1]
MGKSDRRNETLVSTKLRYPMGSGPNDGGLSRHRVIEACEAPRYRLAIDHIDILHLHEIDPARPLEETICALDGEGRAASATLCR